MDRGNKSKLSISQEERLIKNKRTSITTVRDRHLPDTRTGTFSVVTAVLNYE
jgi:hypothetical protein